MILLFFFALLCSAAASLVPEGRRGYGFIGYGIPMYDPNCAWSCRGVISSAPLNCGIPEKHEMHGSSDLLRRMDMDMEMPSPYCYATNDAFLQTLAYCILQKCQCEEGNECEYVEDWKIEQYWHDNVAGYLEVDEQPAPKESWRQTVDRISEPPTKVMKPMKTLNETMLVNEEDYIAAWNAQEIVPRLEWLHSTYGIVILVTGAFIPLALSFLRFVPFPDTAVNWINAYIIYPPLWGTEHRQPLGESIGLVPTRGQALFISYLMAINLILCAVSNSTIMPHSWYSSKHEQLMSTIANRTGVLSFANLPLLLLYSSRNNFLLKLTNWSHSTFLLLHRWVASIATIEAIIHSILYLRVYVERGTSIPESKVPYWWMGIIATVAMSVLLPTSILKLRQIAYEAFLAWHILLSILTVVGCYYHILWRFGNQWGYETWIIIASVVWGFDRLARFARMARYGIRMATVTVIDDTYIRLDVSGVAATGGHAYLFFPTLSWRFWENHPLSIAASVVPPSCAHGSPAMASGDSAVPHSDEKTGAIPSVMADVDTGRSCSSQRDASLQLRSNSSTATHGLTFFIRKQRGATKQLMLRKRVPVLIEASYGHACATLSTPNVVCIAGGVGITAVLPYLRRYGPCARLFWGVRDTAIVEAMHDLMTGMEKEVFVCKRMDVSVVLEKEIQRVGKEGVTIVVSGPPQMSDEVRVAVSRLGKRARGKVELIDESFSW